VRHRHDVHIGELIAAFSPVGMREDVVPPDFAARFDFTALGNAPVEQRVVARDAVALLRRLHVFQKRREAPDHAALVQ
jgi:hypothetical protein